MPVLEQVLEQYKGQVKVVFKHFPLRSHAFAYKAAQASIAAQRQGKFWLFHDMLFRQYNHINDQRINEIRKVLKLDRSQFEKEMAATRTSARITGDVTHGRDAGVRGTPTVFVNGKVLRTKTLAGFRRAIAAALGK